jgi:hypothetical protein
MSLSGPSAVSTGQTFTIEINADPPPGVPIAGFASEVLLPSGLTWVQRPSCQDENQTSVNGLSPSVCKHGGGQAGEARHAVVSVVEPPPLTPLDTPLSTLVEIDVRCTAPGSHTLTLTAAVNQSGPGYSPFGALYFDVNTQQVPVKTTPYDFDGNTDVEQVADTMAVSCTGTPLPTTPCPSEGCPSPTPTRTPIFTPTSTPTQTPCPPEGCPTIPPTPTFTPSPTPTPCPPEGCPLAGMSLSGSGFVTGGETFTLSVNADPAPPVGIAGYSSELVIPDGVYPASTDCQAENQTTVNGYQPGVCTRMYGPPLRHVIISEVGPPPLATFDQPLDALLEIQFVCKTPGARTFAILTIPQSPFGAAFYDANSNQIALQSFPYDIDGDTVTEFVADTFTMTCGDYSTPTLLPDCDGCLPRTSTGTPPNTPALETPDVSGETPIPQGPTATSTLVSELVDPPAVITPGPTDFSEVSPARATAQGTALGDVQSPDAGDGPADDGDAPLAVLGALTLALVAVVYAAARRAGA